ncbi:hypothetical protein AB0L40_13225 [Patulibacter sp. NPDC049589]|uniref:hypothetical protein n=1 Tax=Patulibacter sp. NPDC049589 TaxID=3154731 RepID=UPI00343C1C27
MAIVFALLATWIVLNGAFLGLVAVANHRGQRAAALEPVTVTARRTPAVAVAFTA